MNNSLPPQLCLMVQLLQGELEWSALEGSRILCFSLRSPQLLPSLIEFSLFIPFTICLPPLTISLLH